MSRRDRAARLIEPEIQRLSRRFGLGRVDGRTMFGDPFRARVSAVRNDLQGSPICC